MKIEKKAKQIGDEGLGNVLLLLLILQNLESGDLLPEDTVVVSEAIFAEKKIRLVLDLTLMMNGYYPISSSCRLLQVLQIVLYC